MEEDESWADNAHNHMDTEPMFQRAPPLHPRHVFAEGVSQEGQHHQRAGDTNIESEPGSWGVVLSDGDKIGGPGDKTGEKYRQKQAEWRRAFLDITDWP